MPETRASAPIAHHQFGLVALSRHGAQAAGGRARWLHRVALYCVRSIRYCESFEDVVSSLICTILAHTSGTVWRLQHGRRQPIRHLSCEAKQLAPVIPTEAAAWQCQSATAALGRARSAVHSCNLYEVALPRSFRAGPPRNRPRLGVYATTSKRENYARRLHEQYPRQCDDLSAFR